MKINKVGLGMDIHRLGSEHPNSYIYLGGVKIPNKRPIIAHSDGDVLLHALVDAILGTFNGGDIGTHFPPNDAKWKDYSSQKFLEFSLDLLKLNGGALVNIDGVIVCEEPKISHYREEIINNLIKLLNLDKSCVSIKGKTAEKLGLIGNNEAIFAQVIVSTVF